MSPLCKSALKRCSFATAPSSTPAAVSPSGATPQASQKKRKFGTSDRSGGEAQKVRRVLSTGERSELRVLLAERQLAMNTVGDVRKELERRLGLEPGRLQGRGKELGRAVRYEVLHRLHQPAECQSIARALFGGLRGGGSEGEYTRDVCIMLLDGLPAALAAPRPRPQQMRSHLASVAGALWEVRGRAAALRSVLDAAAQEPERHRLALVVGGPLRMLIDGRWEEEATRAKALSKVRICLTSLGAEDSLIDALSDSMGVSPAERTLFNRMVNDQVEKILVERLQTLGGAPTPPEPGSVLAEHLELGEDGPSAPLHEATVQAARACVADIDEALEILRLSTTDITAACPSQHRLVEFRTDEAGFECNICHGVQPFSAQMFQCRACDYDLCLLCATKEAHPASPGSEQKAVLRVVLTHDTPQLSAAVPQLLAQASTNRLETLLDEAAAVDSGTHANAPTESVDAEVEEGAEEGGDGAGGAASSSSEEEGEEEERDAEPEANARAETPKKTSEILENKENEDANAGAKAETPKKAVEKLAGEVVGGANPQAPMVSDVTVAGG